MNQALTYFYYIYNKILDLFFNDLKLSSNVSVGWIFIGILIFFALISGILSIPKVGIKGGGSHGNSVQARDKQ